MNGRPGDDAILDILVHRLSVFGSEADDLIREIVRYGGEQVLRGDRATLLPYPRPQGGQLKELVTRLRALRNKL